MIDVARELRLDACGDVGDGREARDPELRAACAERRRAEAFGRRQIGRDEWAGTAGFCDGRREARFELRNSRDGFGACAASFGDTCRIAGLRLEAGEDGGAAGLTGLRAARQQLGRGFLDRGVALAEGLPLLDGD